MSDSIDPDNGATCPSCRSELPAGVEVCPRCEETRTEGPPEGARPAASTGLKRVADYRILREIGSGGMGTVFEAEDEKMQRRVALKVLSSYQGLSDKSQRRFEREAWIAGKLDHPNLVKVHERGSWEGLSYYSMELVRGGSLHDVVRNMKRWGRDERLGLAFGSREYVHWAIQQVIETARGLDFAHRHGVVHRDVKPMNLLLGEEPRIVKITDFGLAIDTMGPRTTTEGKLLGTLAYMAPEQILGKQSEISARTDVYALGVTLFELLTLELPFEGRTQEMYLNAVLTAEARRPSKLNTRVGRDLEIVIRKTLEKDPRHRYASAAAFADDLENVLRLRPIVAQPPSLGARIVKWVRRKPIHAALAALILVGGPALAVLGQRYAAQRRVVLRSEVDALWKDVRWLSQKEKNREAVDAATKLLRLDPGHVQALRARAIAHANLAGAGSVVEHQRLALDDVERLIALQPEASWPYGLEGLLLETFGRADDAAVARAKAADRRSKTPSDDDLHFDGMLAIENEDYESALRLFTELSAQRPNDPVTFLYLGIAHARLNHVEEAASSYRWALAMNPDDVYTHIELGVLLTENGALDQGAGHLRRALELDSSKATIHEALATNYLAQGRSAAADPAAAREWFERAESEARAAIALDPAPPFSHINLGASLIERHRLLETPDPKLLSEARDCFSALATWKDDPRAYAAGLTNLCDVLIQLDQLDRALETCRQVTEIQPDSALGYYNLAGVHARLNRPSEALAALARDLELGDQDWQYLAADPWFEKLRGDPRFQKILVEMRRASSQKE